MSRPSPYAPARTPRSRPYSRYAGLLVLAMVAVLAALPASTPAHAEDGEEPPAKPTGLEVSTETGSLDVSVEWDDVDGATSYLVRWRVPAPGNKLNEGVKPQSSGTTITVDDYGEWVVRVQACNDAGCGKPLAKRFTVEPESTRETPPDPTPEPAPLQVSITASPANPQVGEAVTLSPAISNAPSDGGPSYSWHLEFDGSWSAWGTDPTFSYIGWGAESQAFRVTVTYGSGASATSDPLTVTWAESAPEPPSEPNRAPVVNENAAQYDPFVNPGMAPRGMLVTKSFGGIFSDPDGDALTYASTLPNGRSHLVEAIQTGGPNRLVGIRLESDSDWGAITPALPDPLVTDVTLTATDPDGLSASVTGPFHTDWESHPKLVAAEANGDAIFMVFNQDVQAAPGPTPGQFTVNVVNADGTAGTNAINGVSVSGSLG